MLTRPIRERDVEERLVAAASHVGGIAYKFTSPGRRNVPDRLVVLPKVVPFFVECKAPGCKPTAAQQREHERLRALGATVFVIDGLLDGTQVIQHMLARAAK